MSSGQLGFSEFHKAFGTDVQYGSFLLFDSFVSPANRSKYACVYMGIEGRYRLYPMNGVGTTRIVGPMYVLSEV